MIKKEWEKYFNKTWNKLSVGQQKKLVIDVDGQEYADSWFFPSTHISNYNRDGTPIPDKNGKPQKREWQTFEPKGSLSLGITKRRKYYDYMITKYNYPKLDRIVGSKLG